MPKHTPYSCYAVSRGRQVGIFDNWPPVQAATVGFKGARFMGFHSRDEAEAWLRDPAPVVKRKKEEETLLVADNEAVAYCDGSALGNGSQQARAGAGVYFDPSLKLDNISHRLSPADYPSQTNQVAELVGIKLALLALEPHQGPVVLVSDSQYAIKCLTAWLPRWKDNGWQTKTGPVVNRALIESIDILVQARKARGQPVRFHWVKGHAKTLGNIKADQLARLASALPVF